MILLRDRSKKWARQRMKTRIMSGEIFTTAEEVMTLGFLPDWSLLLILAQVVTANTKTRSVWDQTTLPCKSVPPATDANCTPVELSRTMMMLRKIFYRDMKTEHLNWQIKFGWDDGLQVEHKIFLTGQLEFKILIYYTLKSTTHFLFLEALQTFYTFTFTTVSLNVFDNFLKFTSPFLELSSNFLKILKSQN